MAKPYKSVLTRPQLRQMALFFRHRVSLWLQPRLPAYFTALEARFHDQAEAAPSDVRRHDWFTAALLLQKERQGLADAFLNHLLKAVETFFLHYEAYLEEFIQDFSTGGGELELVNNSRLEEDLVVLRASHRAARSVKEGLERLTAHMAAVIQPKALPQAGIPLSPRVMANCLRMALKRWPGSAESRFLFYELMADELLTALDELFPPLIQALEALGLEPVENATAQPARMRRSSAPVAPSLQGATAPDGGEGTLFSVVGMVRQLDGQARQALGLGPSLAATGPAVGMAIRPEALVAVLDELRDSLGDLPEELSQARQAQRRLKAQMTASVGRALEAKQARLHNLDQQVMDVITLLFDFVLDDDLMPDAMKVLLVRLQIPILQIAIRDKTFLTNRRHPARRLVNNLSRAAVRWIDAPDWRVDTLYTKIRRAVEAILAGDATDLHLYQRVNGEFERFIQGLERGARVAEERVSQVARGKEQLALARRRVDEVLSLVHDGRQPEPVRRLLDEPWRDVLMLTLLREGEQSSHWRHALETTRRIAQGAALSEGELAALMGEVRRGLASIAYDPNKAARLLDRYQACCRQGRCDDPDGERRPRRQGGQVNLVTPPDHFQALVQGLEEGQWIRWRQPNGTEWRGKLAWRGETADLLLFVDMRGRKLAEYTSAELVERFRAGQAALLDDIDQPLMDRAFRCMQRAIGAVVGR